MADGCTGGALATGFGDTTMISPDLGGERAMAKKSKKDKKSKKSKKK
jgi:hypothetical protein